MEKLLLGLDLPGDELDIVHQEKVRHAEFFPEFAVAPGLDGVDELVGEVVPFDIHDAEIRPGDAQGVGDGVQQMGLAKAGVPVNKQGVVFGGGILGDRQGGGIGDPVGGSHHEFIEGELIAPQEFLAQGGLAIDPPGQLLVPDDLNVEIGGEDLLQGVLYQVQVAGHDDILTEFRGGMQNEAVIQQLHHLAVAEPGADRGGGQVLLQQL